MPIRGWLIADREKLKYRAIVKKRGFRTRDVTEFSWSNQIWLSRIDRIIMVILWVLSLL